MKAAHGQLLKWKQALTVPEAAQHLGAVFQEPVAEADVLQFALEGHLARRAMTAEQLQELQEDFAKNISATSAVESLGQTATRVRNADSTHDRIFRLGDEGIFDLPLIGGERLDVQQEYYRLTTGASVDLIDIDGAYVEFAGRRFRLQELREGGKPLFAGDLDTRFDYLPAGGLPADHVLVVRRTVLEEFIQRTEGEHTVLSQEPGASPLTRECATWGEMAIVFTSDERVQISAPGYMYTGNYVEMGFADHRTGAPNLAWVQLRELAELNGEITRSARGWTRVEKRMQEIRRGLKAHFAREGIRVPATDPLPFANGRGYRTMFRLSLHRGFEF